MESGVTRIGDNAFSVDSNIGYPKLSVTLPDTLEEIGSYAFLWQNLQSVVFPSGLKTIHYAAFANTLLRSIYIPSSVTYIDSSAFPSEHLTSIQLEEGNTAFVLQDGCLFNADMTEFVAVEGARLTELTIPDKVKHIGGMLMSNTQIKTVHVGARADEWTIYNVGGVENFTVSAENETLCAVDGVVFSKDKTVLVRYPSGRKDTSYTIPEGVTSLGEYTFCSGWMLTALVFPSSFTEITEEIGGGYFIRTYTVPKEVTYIAPQTLGYYYGNKLENVLIMGVSGSAAEKYASDNGFVFHRLGAVEDEIASGFCGTDVTWSLRGKTLTISGTGAMFDYNVIWSMGQTDAPWEGYSFNTVVVAPGVTHIGNNAFRMVGGWSDERFSVTLPEGLLSIGEGAFYSRTGLYSITLPESLESVGIEAFSFSGISDLQLPAKVQTIGEGAFGALSLNSITVSPENAWFCVEGGTLLSADKTRLLAIVDQSNFRIADHVRTLDAYAFDGTDALRTLHIGSGVTSLGRYQNGIGAQNLETITVSQDNPMFSAQDGVLFSKDGTRLLVYPACRPGYYYIVPSNVTAIASGAFNGVSSLGELTLSPSMTSIPAYGLYFFALERIVIPSGVQWIGEYAIQRCIDEDLANLTIVGVKNSAAEKYAKENGARFEVLNTSKCVHIPMLVPERAATFASAGCKEHYACTQCGQLFADAEGTKKITLKDIQIPKLPAEGATGTCGNDLTWKFEKGVFTISGTGAMWSYTYNYDEATETSSTTAPWVDFDIRKIVVEEGVTEIGNYAFFMMEEPKEVELPSTLESIGTSAFDSANLQSITLPENLKRLGSFALFENFEIKGKFYIPASLVEIQEGALAANLVTAFEVDPANPAFCAESGVLYSKDKTVLYTYPVSGRGKTWTVPDGVKTIQAYALVDFTDTITTIHIPESVETICGTAWDWPALKTIYYGGTLAQWDELVERNVQNDRMYISENVTVMASDGANNAYRVNYENVSDDVINPNPAAGEFDKVLTLKNPTRTGYTFGGWYYEEDFSGKKVTSIPKTNRENVTLYAKWTPITYTISFNGNGNKSGEMA